MKSMTCEKIEENVQTLIVLAHNDVVMTIITHNVVQVSSPETFSRAAQHLIFVGISCVDGAHVSCRIVLDAKDVRPDSRIYEVNRVVNYLDILEHEILLVTETY